MSLIRGVLLAGNFRSQHDLDKMSPSDQRNTLIVELAGRSKQTNLQSFNDDVLAGMGAVLVFLRTSRIRDDHALKGMTADDMRNILIVELGAQTKMSGSALQGMSNIELVQLGLGKPQPGGLTNGNFIRGVLLGGNSARSTNSIRCRKRTNATRLSSSWQRTAIRPIYSHSTISSSVAREP